jgi:hypothetical protein
MNKAQKLADLWTQNEKTMPEQAAYLVACEQLGIDPDEGYDLLAEQYDKDHEGE